VSAPPLWPTRANAFERPSAPKPRPLASDDWFRSAALFAAMPMWPLANTSALVATVEVVV
jgi:hypothetical protein